jgi:hypothetical protein
MKKTSRPIAHTEYNRQRKLRLTKEAIRTLRPSDLTAVNGGVTECTTTSYTTEKKQDSTGKC